MTKIKICGITDVEDALAAAELGADAVGFVFADSPRRVTPERAAAIASKLPPFVVKVGVFAGAPPREAAAIAARCGLDAIQIYAGERGEAGMTPLETRLRVIVAVRVGSAADAEMAAGIEAHAVLLDSKADGAMGGTGASFDWSLLSNLDFASPVILAGGLRPDNVAQAVRLVRPYAVDVSSGVEYGPGKKDRGKIKAFIEAVRLADAREAEPSGIRGPAAEGSRESGPDGLSRE